jgi:hypothetical protein
VKDRTVHIDHIIRTVHTVVEPTANIPTEAHIIVVINTPIIVITISRVDGGVFVPVENNESRVGLIVADRIHKDERVIRGWRAHISNIQDSVAVRGLLSKKRPESEREIATNVRASRESVEAVVEI